jgi:hypothetical protein
MIFLDLLIYSPFFLVMSCLYYRSFGPFLWTIVCVLMENIRKGNEDRIESYSFS